MVADGEVVVVEVVWGAVVVGVVVDVDDVVVGSGAASSPGAVPSTYTEPSSLANITAPSMTAGVAERRRSPVL